MTRQQSACSGLLTSHRASSGVKYAASRANRCQDPAVTWLRGCRDALSALQLLVLAVASVVVAVSAVSPALGGLAPAVLAVRSVSGGVCVVAGAVTWARGAGRALGGLFVAAGCALCLINLGLWHGELATTLRIGTGGYAPFGAVLGHLLVSYPTGRLQTRLERLTVTGLYVGAAGYSSFQLAVGDSRGLRYCQPDGCADMFGVLVRSDTAARLGGRAFAVLELVVFGLVVLVVARRYRAAGPPARRALRPAVVSVAGAAGGAVTISIVRGFALQGGGATRIFIALVWGGSAAGVAVGLLLGVLRSRLVLYGMGDLVSRLDSAPVGEVRAVLARLLGDPSLRVLPAAPEGRAYLDAGGARLQTPGNGRRWLPVGVIEQDLAAAPDPQVLQAVLGVLRLLLDNLRLQDRLRGQLVEVQDSRARIVAAADGERLRIERDLHDGAQQHLVSSALSVRLARQRLRTAPDTAEELLAQAEQELATSLVEIRQLARGLHPAILTDRGVGAAVESLAQRLPLQVQLTDGLSNRHPVAVETTAYFVVCEALVNVTRYAGVDAADVRLWQTPAAVLVEIVDYGCGGADADRGTGLRGLADRLAALAGTLTVTSMPGTGTTLRAEIPLTGVGPPGGAVRGPVPGQPELP